MSSKINRRHSLSRDCLVEPDMRQTTPWVRALFVIENRILGGEAGPPEGLRLITRIDGCSAVYLIHLDAEAVELMRGVGDGLQETTTSFTTLGCGGL